MLLISLTLSNFKICYSRKFQCILSRVQVSITKKNTKTHKKEKLYLIFNSFDIYCWLSLSLSFWQSIYLPLFCLSDCQFVFLSAYPFPYFVCQSLRSYGRLVIDDKHKDNFNRIKRSEHFQVKINISHVTYGK